MACACGPSYFLRLKWDENPNPGTADKWGFRLSRNTVMTRTWHEKVLSAHNSGHVSITGVIHKVTSAVDFPYKNGITVSYSSLWNWPWLTWTIYRSLLAFTSTTNIYRLHYYSRQFFMVYTGPHCCPSVQCRYIPCGNNSAMWEECAAKTIGHGSKGDWCLQFQSPDPEEPGRGEVDK